MTGAAVLKYDQACRALEEARSVDEVKGLADKAEAMRIYARRAKNRGLEIDAAEIRLRAERRVGELLADARMAGTRHLGGRAPNLRGANAAKPTLAELGVDNKLSSRAQAIAGVPRAEFDRLVAAWRQRAARGEARISVYPFRFAAKPRGRARAARPAAPLYTLSDGTGIQAVAFGSLDRLIRRAEIEARLLRAIEGEVTPSSSLATIGDAFSSERLAELIAEAEAGGRRQ
jgi:hypothetical protein